MLTRQLKLGAFMRPSFLQDAGGDAADRQQWRGKQARQVGCYHSLSVAG